MSSPTPAPGASPTAPKTALPPVYSIPASTPSGTTANKYNINTADPYDLGSLGDQQVWIGTHQVQVTRARDSSASSNDYASAKDLLNQTLALYSTNREAFDGVRQALEAGGYYGTTAATDVAGRAAGSWDATALKDAISDYLKYTAGTSIPTDFNDWLQGTDASGKPLNNGGAGAKTPGAASQVQLSDPTQLSRYFNAAVSNSLGRQATPDELNKFISSYHANETVQQQLPASSAQTGIDPRGQALQSAHTLDPEGFKNHQTTGYMDAFYNMFLPGGSQLAQTPTDQNTIQY